MKFLDIKTKKVVWCMKNKSVHVGNENQYEFCMFKIKASLYVLLSFATIASIHLNM